MIIPINSNSIFISGSGFSTNYFENQVQFFTSSSSFYGSVSSVNSFGLTCSINTNNLELSYLSAIITQNGKTSSYLPTKIGTIGISYF